METHRILRPDHRACLQSRWQTPSVGEHRGTGEDLDVQTGVSNYSANMHSYPHRLNSKAVSS
jgi:hypothetical protein